MQDIRHFFVAHLTAKAYLFCVFAFFNVSAQPSHDISMFANKAVKVITNKDGLPQGTVLSIASDSSGRLWVGTQDGAAYYNGRKWTTVNMPQRTVSNWVQTISVDSDSSIWFGVRQGGVHKYKNGSWQSFDTSNGLANMMVRRIFETHDDSGRSVLWFGTPTGLSVYSYGRWKTYTKSDGLPDDVVNDISMDGDGSLLFATDNGVVKYRNGKWELLDAPPILKHASITRIKHTSDGSLWLGCGEAIGHLRHGLWKIFDIRGKLASNRIMSIHESHTGEIWFGTQSGVWRYVEANSSHSDAAMERVSLDTDGPRSNGPSVLAIHETQDGSLWFGVFTGLVRYRTGGWQSIKLKADAAHGGTTALCETSDGDYWFGSETGLIRYHDGVWKSVPEVEGSVLSLLQSADHALWVSVLLKGVYRYKNGQWDRFTKTDGLVSNSNWCITQSDDGAVWVGSDDGATKYLNGRWYQVTTHDGLPDNIVSSIRQARDGSVWFATMKGAARYTEGQFRVFTTQDGLSSNAIASIHEAQHSDSFPREKGIWFGTFENGVTRFDPESNTWEIFNDTTAIPLCNNVVLSIVEDVQGRLYFLTNNGITRFTFHHDGAIRSEEFTVEDGLPNNEGIAGALMVDSHKRVWAGTTEGPAFLDPYEEMADENPKSLLFDDIYVNGYTAATPPPSDVTFKYFQNNIVFRFSLLSFFKGNETRYQVQLVGYDANPLPWTDDFKKEYTNLSEGSYIFKLWGKDYNRNVSGPLEFSFSINPPFWKRWWFVALALASLVACVVFIVRMFTARKLKKRLALLERQQLIEQERIRISQDMHDAVGASLSRIAILSDRVKSEYEGQNITGETADKHLERITSIGSTASDVIDQMNEIIWSLTPQYDTLEGLVNYVRSTLNKLLDASDTKYTLRISEELPDIQLTPDFRRNVFFIFKEAVTNVFKHSGATHVEITITVSEKELQMVIHDNGTGMRDVDDGRAHFGLQNMRSRAKAISANLVIESNTQGTAIRFWVPFPNNPPI